MRTRVLPFSSTQPGLLGFEGLQLNSYGAIAATDYATETAGAVATATVNLGRLVQDLLLWCNPEVKLDSLDSPTPGFRSAASCRKSATLSRWSTRAFWRAGAWRKRKRFLPRSTILPLEMLSIPKTTSSRWSLVRWSVRSGHSGSSQD
jgi:hypothetical protein